MIRRRASRAEHIDAVLARIIRRANRRRRWRGLIDLLLEGCGGVAQFMIPPVGDSAAAPRTGAERRSRERRR